MLYHDNRPRPGQSLTLKFVAKLSLEVEILAALKFLKIPPYCDCWHGGALFSLAQAHRMRNCYSALLYCTIMFLLCCANIICQRYCCMKTRYGFTAVALKVYDVLACVAVFSVSFQASGSRARHGTEVTKKKKKKRPFPRSYLFALAQCLRETSPSAMRKRKRLLRRLTTYTTWPG